MSGCFGYLAHVSPYCPQKTSGGVDIPEIGWGSRFLAIFPSIFFLILSLTFVGATQGSGISAQVLGVTNQEQFALMVLVHSLGQEV